MLVHDAHCQDDILHHKLVQMGPENGLPVALGVIRDVEEETYDEAVNRQIAEVRAASKAQTFDQLTATLEQWEVK